MHRNFMKHKTDKSDFIMFKNYEFNFLFVTMIHNITGKGKGKGKNNGKKRKFV